MLRSEAPLRRAVHAWEDGFQPISQWRCEPAIINYTINQRNVKPKTPKIPRTSAPLFSSSRGRDVRNYVSFLGL